MSQSWIRGPVCGVDNCISRLYRTVDGLKICQYGHVMDGNIEINDDQDDNFVQTKRLNIDLTGVGGDFLASQRSIGHKGVYEKDKKLYGLAAKELYLECVQTILTKQVKIVAESYFGNIKELNIEEDMTSVVKLYWLRTLSSCLTNASNPTKEVDLGDANVHLPSTLDLICIIYLSLLKLNLTVYIQDIYSDILQSRIPYMKCIQLISQSQLSKLPSSYINLLGPKKLPTEDELYENIHIIGKRINYETVTLSSNYFLPLVFKVFSNTLLLPNAPEMFNLWISIVEISKIFDDYPLNLKTVSVEPKILSKPKRLWRRRGIPKSKIIEFPELRIIALIIFTIKFYFMADTSERILHKRRKADVIETETETVNNKRTFDLKIWLQNLTQYELNHEFPISQSNNVEEDILHWSDQKTNRYCQWVYENLIPKKNKTFNILNERTTEMGEAEELNMMDKRLFQIFNIDQQEYVSSGKRKLDVNVIDGELIDFYGGYTSETTLPPPSTSDINEMENYLFDKLKNEFGVTRGILESCYRELETQLKHNIKRNL